MRAVIQRVSEAQVTVAEATVAAIGPGLVVFVGIGHGDDAADARYLADKTAGLRIFEDAAGKMNLSVAQQQGELLVVSQFTLWGDCRKGKRPGFGGAMPTEAALPLYQEFVALLRQKGVAVAEVVFQAQMQVSLINDGPVTMLLDSHKAF